MGKRLFYYVHVYTGFAGCSVLDRPLVVQWVFGSIPHSGPIELFLLPGSTGVIKAAVIIILSVGWCL